ncbi:MAG TPA: hypothetical protein VN836_12080 [Verrucomicrobiae bacterium]|nr:hypothetical protein [Verrucomicrobiae bacterium]
MNNAASIPNCASCRHYGNSSECLLQRVAVRADFLCLQFEHQLAPAPEVTPTQAAPLVEPAPISNPPVVADYFRQPAIGNIQPTPHHQHER